MLLASVGSRRLGEASAVKQHGAMCASGGALCACGVGLLSEHTGLAKAVVVHPSEEREGDDGPAGEANEEAEPPLTLPC